MVTKFTLMALFGLGMVVLLANDASAGCIKLSSGGQYCASWITGSEICGGKAAGVQKLCTDNNDPSTCVGEVLCQAGGTFTFVNNTPVQTDLCNDTTSYFPLTTDNCAISGIAFCVNNAGKASHAQGQPFTFDGVLTGATNTFSCTRNGKCTFTNVELLPSTEDLSQVQCINPNWTAVDFTAAEFKAKSCFCSGTYNLSTDPPTCSTSPDGETCLIEKCTVDLTDIKINDTRAYICTGQLLPPA
jgi:hypothetical protein